MKKTLPIILAALLCAAPVFADEAVIEEIAADDAGIMLISELEEAVAVDTVVEEVVVDAEVINAIAAICGVEVTPEFVEALLGYLVPAVEEVVAEEAAEEVVEEEAVVEEAVVEEAVVEAPAAVVDVDAVIAIAATYNITLTPELINTVLASGVEVTPAILQNAALMFGAVISEEEAAAVIALLNPVAEEAVVEEVVEEEAVVEEAAEEVVAEELVVVEVTPAEALYALAAAYGVEINDEFVAQILALVAAVEVEVVAEEELVAVEEEAIAEEVVEEVVEEEPVSKYPVILTKIPGFGLFTKLLSLFTFRG